jgi:8-oxo-dGTP pyrophosphatase MutT (NUDIX family)
MSKPKESLVHPVDDWATHSDSFRRTGFWGAFGAAGAIFLAQDTGRLLLTRRSHRVLQPGTWGTVGGALDHGEGPIEAVIREAREELSVELQHEDLHLCYVFRDTKTQFSYHNYTALVPTEFEPELNWEVSEHAWVEFGDWPDPLHFGMQHWLGDEHGERSLRTLIDQVGRVVDLLKGK